MSRSFGNFLARKQNQEFTYRFSRLCENIARSGVRWDDYCRYQLYPTLAEGNYSSPDELLGLLNEADPAWWNLWMAKGNKGKTAAAPAAPAPAADPNVAKPTQGDNWVDMGYPSIDAYNAASPQEKAQRRKQAAAKKNGTPQPDVTGGSTAEAPPTAPQQKKKSGVSQERLDQETKLYQAAAQSIQGRFQQALQQFYNMVRDDAHANNNPHQYEVLRHFMKKIEPAYQQALTGLKARASKGNEMRDIFQGASRQRYDQRQADSAARSGVQPNAAGGVDIGRGPGGEITRTTIGTAGGKASAKDTEKFGPASFGDGTGGEAMSPEDMARFAPSSAMVGGSAGEMPAGFNPNVAQFGAGDAVEAPAAPPPVPAAPVGSAVSPDTQQAVNAQAGGYAGKPDLSGQFGAADGAMPNWSDDEIRPGAEKRSTGRQDDDWRDSRKDLDDAERERRAMVGHHSESYNPYKKLNYRRYHR